jgi:hypothetical protein
MTPDALTLFQCHESILKSDSKPAVAGESISRNVNRKQQDEEEIA